MKNGFHWFLAELLGTFILILFGCGAVASSVAMGATAGVFQVAIVWGLGLALAIALTGSHSGAHLNPAITIALCLWTGFPKARVAGYIAAQMLGAFLAAAAVYAIYSPAIGATESALGIERGAPGSEATAMIFGEYFPSPGGKPWDDAARAKTGLPQALIAEFIGTAVLALGVFGLTSDANPNRARHAAPLAIGLLVAILICIIGPVTMCCLNPARDLAPRIFSALVGWKSLPFSANGSGWLTVYVLTPIIGAIAGMGLGTRLFPVAKSGA
jgi:glycerol uptake facilitator protein